jgi:hypothetical protein
MSTPASPTAVRGRSLVETETLDWVRGAVSRVGAAMTAGLVPGAALVSVYAVDKSSQRTMAVRGSVERAHGLTSSTLLTSCCWFCSPSLPCLLFQLEVSRSPRDGLSTSRSPSSDVQLSSHLATAGLPSVVDSLRTLWPINPYDPLPADSSATGAVMEFSLLDPSTGTRVPLPNVTGASNSMPVHFRIPVGT